MAINRELHKTGGSIMIIVDPNGILTELTLRLGSEGKYMATNTMIHMKGKLKDTLIVDIRVICREITELKEVNSKGKKGRIEQDRVKRSRGVKIRVIILFFCFLQVFLWG